MPCHKLRRPDAERISYEDFSSRFTYRDGEILRVGKGKKKTGSVKSNGYHRIHIDRQHYLTHHLVWFWHHRTWPEQLDHIDRNRLNNRIENLRECSVAENLANRAPHNIVNLASMIVPRKGGFTPFAKLKRKTVNLGMCSTYAEALMKRKAFLMANNIQWKASTT